MYSITTRFCQNIFLGHLVPTKKATIISIMVPVLGKLVIIPLGS